MKRLIWDLPTRIFHWLLVLSVFMAYGVAQLSEEDTWVFNLHMFFGVVASLLLLWRILWGFLGSKHSKFQALAFPPLAIVNYFRSILRGRGEFYAGHNPGGAFAVIAMLLLVGITVVSGLLRNSGGELFEEIHEISPNLLILLVIFHILGVLLATRMHKENYALAMITGKKTAGDGDAISKPYLGSATLMITFLLSGSLYFLAGFDFNAATFTAPGTNWGISFVESDDRAHDADGSRAAQGKTDDDHGRDD